MDIPNEMVLEICKHMDISTLSKFTQCCSSLKNLCKDILDKRKDFLGRELWKKGSNVWYRHDTATGEYVYIVEAEDNLVLVQQIYSWILKGDWMIPNTKPIFKKLCGYEKFELEFSFKDFPKIYFYLKQSGYKCDHSHYPDGRLLY